MNRHASFSLKIEFQYPVSLRKYNGVTFAADWVVFEDEVHADALKILHISHPNRSTANRRKFFVNAFCIGSFSLRFLEYEQLVWLLSIFYEIFACNDTEHSLIRANIHSYDLISLPSLRWQQIDRDFPVFDFLPGF